MKIRKYNSQYCHHLNHPNIWFCTCMATLLVGLKLLVCLDIFLLRLLLDALILWDVAKINKCKLLVWAIENLLKLQQLSNTYRKKAIVLLFGGEAWEQQLPYFMEKCLWSSLTHHLNLLKVYASKLQKNIRPQLFPIVWLHAFSHVFSESWKKMSIKKPITMSNNLM